MPTKEELLNTVFSQFPALKEDQYQDWLDNEVSEMLKAIDWLANYDFGKDLPHKISKLIASLLVKEFLQDCGRKAGQFFYSGL